MPVLFPLIGNGHRWGQVAPSWYATSRSMSQISGHHRQATIERHFQMTVRLSHWGTNLAEEIVRDGRSHCRSGALRNRPVASLNANLQCADENFPKLESARNEYADSSSLSVSHFCARIRPPCSDRQSSSDPAINMMPFTCWVRRALATTMVTKPQSVTSAGYKPDGRYGHWQICRIGLDRSQLTQNRTRRSW